MINGIFIFGSILLASLTIACIVILLRNINYAYGDACALFAHANTLRGFSIINRCWGTVNTLEINGSLTPIRTLYNTPYVLFLNVLKWFSPEKRLRGGQFVNLLFFFLYLISFFYLIKTICESISTSSSVIIMASFIFTLLLSIRTKILFMCLFPQAEMVNYWLYILALILIHQLSVSIFPIYLVLLGAICGLIYRNKGTDIVFVVTVAVYLMITAGSFYNFVLFAMGILLVSIDCILWFFKGLSLHDYLKNILVNDVPTEQEKRTFSSYYSLFLSGLVAMWRLHRTDSLWTSLGSTLIIGIFSIFVIHFAEIRSGSFTVIFLFIPLYLGVSCFIRRININDENGFYFARRQMYILFPLLMLCNAVAFFIFLQKGLYFFMGIYILWATCYFIYQLSRVINYHLSPVLTEEGYYTYHKEVEPFRKSLSAFLASLEEPVVVMGFYLLWGEAHNYFDYRPGKKCICVQNPVSDEDIRRLISFYKITHIVVTPISGFVGPDCSLKEKTLSPVLDGILEKINTASDLIVFRVRERIHP